MTFDRLLWISALSLSACACSPAPKPEPAGGDAIVAPLPEPQGSAVELAGTALPVRILRAEPARSHGLATLRTKDAAGVLLLRVYAAPLYVALTNRRYRLHSELAWIDAAGEVLRIDRMSPDEGLSDTGTDADTDRTWWKSPARVQYVLEALEGALATAGIRTGTTLAIRADVAHDAARLRTPPRPMLTLTVGGRKVTAEIASTTAHRRHGLMFRNTLPADHGMLFVYPGAKERAFWMKNCAMDIAIAYTTADGTIVSIHEMKAAWHTPEGVDLPGYPSGGACAMALEMESGWFRRHGVNAGDRLELPAHIGELQRTAAK